MRPNPALAYFHGDDAYGLERAAEALVERLAADGPVERWRVAGGETNAARLGERLATAAMFGGGAVAIVSDPGPLARTKADREALVALFGRLAPGNGLVFVESVEGNRRPRYLEELAAAVGAAGGEVRAFPAPKEGRLAAWIDERARERGLGLAPGAARELATRVGGFVREGDVDRLRQGQLAVAELDKLALFRPGAPVTVADVRALVAEVVPGSSWAFLDAVGTRRVTEAVDLLERLLASTHELVVLAGLHRRIRELLVAADLVAGGARPADVMKALRLKPYPAEKLVEQTRRWTIAELEAALEGLLEVDAVVRGAEGAADEGKRRLALTLWLVERVGRPSATGAGRG